MVPTGRAQAQNISTQTISCLSGPSGSTGPPGPPGHERQHRLLLSLEHAVCHMQHLKLCSGLHKWKASTWRHKQREAAMDMIARALRHWKPLASEAAARLAKGGDFLLAETGHDQLPLPAALMGFRAVAEGAGLVIH